MLRIYFPKKKIIYVQYFKIMCIFAGINTNSQVNNLIMVDKDLDFLSKCSNEQLQLLTDFILYDKDGKKRYTEQLSKLDNFEDNYPDNIIELLPNIVDELQRFGGNTFFNIVRRHGICYRDILEDVCKKLKVNYNKNNSTELLEQYMLQKFLIMSVDKMTEEDT